MNTDVARFGSDIATSLARFPSADTAPRAIASWLLDGGAQLTSGPHAGGVAGWTDGDDVAAYVYPEITGYYLQWLAWLASSAGGVASLADRARSAQVWLANWVRSPDPPPTRVYLHAREQDWRNEAVFCFDLAMVLRGIAAATRAGLVAPDERLVGDIVAQLHRLIADDGMFDAVRVASASAGVPDRWSTRRGGFLAKAAAGVLGAAPVLQQVDARLRDAAAATMAASLDAAIARPHDETHPALYAIEGALCVPDRRAISPLLPALTNQIDMLLTHAAVDGWLPESRGANGVERLDIVAQALRAAVLLRARCVTWSPDPHALEKMKQVLARCTTPTGALPFAPRSATMQHNVWCAMFAEQALQIARPAVPRSRLLELEAYLV